MFVVDVEYFDWRICDFTKPLVFGEVYVNLVEASDEDLKKTALINVLDDLSRHTCMRSVYLLMVIYLD